MALSSLPSRDTANLPSHRERIRIFPEIPAFFCGSSPLTKTKSKSGEVGSHYCHPVSLELSPPGPDSGLTISNLLEGLIELGKAAVLMASLLE